MRRGGSDQVLAFVKTHGMVLESARGPVPNLAETIAGGRIRGSWWGHPKGHEIWAATRAVRDSKDVLVCRLVEGKITYVHKRLWPALVRLAHRLGKTRLVSVREIHLPTGKHKVELTPFPQWVPAELVRAAHRLTEAEAVLQLGASGVAPAAVKRPTRG